MDEQLQAKPGQPGGSWGRLPLRGRRERLGAKWGSVRAQASAVASPAG